MASSTLWKVVTERMGPKISSLNSLLSWPTPSTTVGSTKMPPAVPPPKATCSCSMPARSRYDSRPVAVFGAHRAGADDQRHTRADDLPGQRGKVEALLRRMRIVFAGRATDDDAVDPGFDQGFEHFRKGGVVDLAFRRQGRNGRRIDAFEFHGFSVE
ncbi:hypothetical protein D3C81_1343490 [compost metagenome]